MSYITLYLYYTEKKPIEAVKNMHWSKSVCSIEYGDCSHYTADMQKY